MVKATTRRKLYALARAYRRLPWLIGDYLVWMENERGEGAYGLFEQETRLSAQQLYDLMRVARQWPKERRIYKLPWSYYRDAGSDLELAENVLESTERLGWSRETMRQCLKKLRKT